jgi:hypothetical protein
MVGSDAAMDVSPSGVPGREQAERRSGNAAKHTVQMPELRRQGSLLPAYKNTYRPLVEHQT